ncbi:hypothetical protein [Sphingomicrobium lutaoense]|uniref:SMODS and SLOG-associating 2TM effector domain-containing protein n=1 Tax=Sphingomicrobium lutaoense TaxID=515949 RepID=A0A839Z3E9_9SPHN|nr:hypothetical protein [Sphingomicrobium lutaoense]MBB3764607.1 hypothetical protein [Sphingomicrobium lutaoense]
MSVDPRADPFQPRLVLRFGITGHRPPRLDPDQHEAIKAACREIFRHSAQALEQLHARHGDLLSPQPPRIKLVTSVAEGADVLAAEAALEAGARLAVCLPFPEPIYARDFTDDKWARSKKLVDQADTVMSLSEYEGGDEAGYEMAGRLMLSQCDILIAVWDGEAARGRGGTTQVIAEAVAMHMPVIHVDAGGKAPPELLWSGLHEAVPDRPSLDGINRADARTVLAALVNALCAPPARPERDALVQFTSPARRKARRNLGWPLLMALSGAKSWRKLQFRAAGEEESAEWLRRHTGPFDDHGRFGKRLNGPLLARFGRADARANQFALRFRSSFVTNYALAGLAVFLALAGLLFPDAKKALIATELFVILLIIANTHGARRNNLHQCWLDRRHLAERLRLLALTATLGRLSLRDVEDGTTHPGWVSWYARASARELGLPAALVDKAYLEKVRASLIGLINEQIDYHRANARAMHRADHRLHHAGDLLFIGTILACVAYLAVAIGTGSVGKLFGVGMTQLVTFVTALFPALAAALYGIRMQGDFASTGERSSVIAQRLLQLKIAIEADPLRIERLAERSRRLGEIMLAEVQQWRLHYETRPLSLPG